MRVTARTGRFTVCAALALGVVAFSARAMAQSVDPFIGTWKMDVAKSTYKPGPAAKSSTVVIEPAGKGLKVSVDVTTPDGPMKWSYTANPDGKDVPVTGYPNGDSVSMTLPSANERVLVFKRGGKPTVTSKAVLSKDGKTMTVTQDGTDPKGQAIHNVLHYVR